MDSVGFVTKSGDRASGGELVRLTGASGTLSTGFGGPDGAYEVKFRIQDEADGQSTVRLLIDGVLAGEILLDKDNRGSGSDNGKFTSFFLDDVAIPAGAEVTLEAERDGGEMVRVDRLILTRTGDMPPPPPPPPPAPDPDPEPEPETAGDGAAALPAVSEMSKYLLIGTTSNSIAKAVNVQNGDLGANIVMLSTEIDDNVDFDLDDVFLHNAGGQWVDADNDWNGVSDYLPGAAPVVEGVSWTGDVALTSPDAKFDMSNVELYGQVGVVSDSGNPASSVSNSEFFADGLGDGYDTTGDGSSLTAAGVTANADAEMAALRAELDAYEDWVTELSPEAVLRPGSGLPGSDGIEDVDIFTINVDQHDTDGDGIAVIDIDMDDNDFKLTNSNIIIDGDGSTFAIFRILGDSNLVLNQSTIVLGDGGIADGDLGAIFVKAAEFADGQGGYNAGESNSGDTVFSFNDTVLNGVGFYDLIVYDETIGNADFDNGTTELKINNGQGCAQFISPKINFNNVRFDLCAPPEPDLLGA
ncbi:hypothetical protein, partial [Paralimibaculum aggregatum]|uniref:hypothetical protein n=1 Tax=Paralimibaculum aggregatum TaxID=3036245 RepID=UPI002553DC9B